MSDLDEGRDLHAAFGTLLADEPGAPWSVSDDVTRGRALQRRRRTRAGAGIGLAAAVVMVFGVFGPLRPHAAVVQPGGTPPTVPGVPQAWFDNITPSLLDHITGVVDWEQSRVDGSAADGFLADLTLVPVSINGTDGDRVVALVPGPTGTGRLTLQWIPGGAAPGPALVRCPRSACPEQGPTSIVGGPVDQGATAGDDAAFPKGAVILDRQYPQGLLELVNYPESPSTATGGAGYQWGLMQGVTASEFLSALGNPLTGPPGPGPDASFVAAQRAIVEPYLNKLGFDVVDARLSTALVDDGRTRIEYRVSVPTNGVGSYTADVIVSTFPTPSGPGYPSGSYFEYCTRDACSDVQIFAPDCPQGAICMTTYWATANPKANPVLGAADGMALARWNGGTAVEVLVGVPECLTCDPVVTGDAPILTKDQGLELATAIGEPAVFAGPTPSVTPTTPASDDAITRTLAGYGFRVLSADTRTNVDGGITRSFNVDINKAADNPVTAFLRLTTYPGSKLPIGAPKVDVDRTVLAGCTATTCTPVLPINVPCPSTSCFQYWTATTTAAYAGIGANTLGLFTSDGTDGAEAVVGPGSCPTCAGLQNLSEPFLTLDQAEEVLGVFTRSIGPAPSPSGTASIASLAACTPDDVKIIPGTGVPSEVTGGRGTWIEIHARNPEVDCVVSGVDSVSLVDGAGTPLAFRYRSGVYQLRDVGDGPMEVSQAVGPVRFALSKYRCDEAPAVPAGTAYVTLDGWTRPVGVELPAASAGVEQCPGGSGAAGNTVYVSGVVRLT